MTDYVHDVGFPATMHPNDNVYSTTRAFRLTFQSDGNLVLRGLDDTNLPVDPHDGSYGDALWASSTAGENVTRCELQEDGNMVLYDKAGNPRWSSRSTGARYLVCQDDGNVVAYDLQRHARWASNTWAGAR